GVPVVGPVQTLTTAGTSTVVTETIPPGFTLTAATCTGLGAGGTATPNLAAGTVTLDALATAAGSNIACTYTHTKLPTLTVSTISNGGTGDFPYSGTNGVTNFTNTTVTPGTPVVGPVQTLTTAGTSTVVTETVPPGFILTAATCTGLSPGGTATPNLAAGTITLDAAATTGSPNLACTFTHSRQTTVSVNVVSNGGIGPFSFTGTNGVTNQILTTLNPGTNVAGPVQAVTTIGGVTTITETVPPGFILTAINCTGLGAGGVATPNLAAGTVTLDAAATASGAAAVCTFTNVQAGPPIMRVAKTGPASFTAGSTGTYNVTLSNIGGSVTTGLVGFTDTLPANLTFSAQT
ncbi:prealbumin-like fold domain-containing protein, partial [Chitinimonas sp. BJB300]|uniref:prealbumin-like fold domain-containing protein n=2 Tax=Chitinimonas sp. BJB300 TaxID=1559339 RepID=UPI000C10ACE5